MATSLEAMLDDFIKLIHPLLREGWSEDQIRDVIDEAFEAWKPEE